MFNNSEPQDALAAHPKSAREFREIGVPGPQDFYNLSCIHSCMSRGAFDYVLKAQLQNSTALRAVLSQLIVIPLLVLLLRRPVRDPFRPGQSYHLDDNLIIISS